MEMKNRICVGVDLGGANLKMASVSEDGAVLKKISVPTEAAKGVDAVLNQIADEALELIATSPGHNSVCCMGVGCPGPLNSNEGIVYHAPNLNWRSIKARDILREKIGIPVALNNDANCAAWGEYFAGAGRGSQTLVVMTLGTGIGGGVIINGRLFKGACDSAGEIGHMTIDYDSSLPYIVNQGGLEHLASATATARFAWMAIEAGEKTSLARWEDDIESLTAKDIYDAANDGDAVAARIMNDVGRYLGIGVANIINVFNPDRIVFTGGMTASWDRLHGPMMQEVHRRAFTRSTEAVQIMPGDLWQDAGLIGAAGLGFIELDEAAGSRQ